jgi:transcriptional regulator with XRE-family HTH domain
MRKRNNHQVLVEAAELIRKAMKRANLSQRKLVPNSGVSRSSLNRALNGKSNFPVSVLFNTVRACGLEVVIRKRVKNGKQLRLFVQ